jgi:branched-chain amino acid aminotransferase
MLVYLNGRFLPEEHAKISVHDRGFLYGDGLFEAVRAYDGEPFLWADHIARFQHGCEMLRIASPLSPGEILRVIKETLARNRLADAIVRFTLSRGVGQRGYSPRGADHPTFLVTPHRAPELPDGYEVITSNVRLLESDPIALFKSINKLNQIMARAEADECDAHEALLTNERGFVVEGTTTNLFWVKSGRICTPPLRGILAGTTRAHVLRLCQKLNVQTAETNIRPRELAQADGLFVTSCAAEIMKVSKLDGRKIKSSPIIRKLQRHYREETFPRIRDYVRSRK